MAAKNYFDHVNKAGQDPTDRAKAASYTCNIPLPDGWYREGVAENIVQGWTHSSSTLIGSREIKHYSAAPQIARRLLASWMGSPGHRENILDAGYKSSGLGVGMGAEGQVYATQNFC